MKIINRYKIAGILLIFAILNSLIIFFFDGTGDSGDSVLHFLYAKYALQHPQHFFNHWAKPLFVLLACPFAQFGFTGIKIFNALVSLATVFFTIKTAEKLNINNSIISALILFFSPLYFVLIFSGLTEPLFALMTISGIYLVLSNKYIAACILISFLPFVRSEGLITVGVFSLFFLLKRKWWFIPLLSAGHIIYSFAGYFVYEDILWVFKKIPYAKMSSNYGSGDLFHFVNQLYYVIGVPIFVLFWIGVIAILWKSVKKKTNTELLILVFAGFLAFFVAHSLFWYFGIFNSMGLKRVLIGVAPSIVIISLLGFNFITEDLLQSNKTLKKVFQGLWIAYILIFPFTNNPASMKWKKDLSLSKDQLSAIAIASFIKKNSLTDARFIYAHPYLSHALNIDHFDPKTRIELTGELKDYITDGDIIIWENWYAVVEHGVKKEQLDNLEDLENIYNVNLFDRESKREIKFSVYKK